MPTCTHDCDVHRYLSLCRHVLMMVMFTGTSHCADMYSCSPDDPPELIQAHKEIENVIGHWIAWLTQLVHHTMTRRYWSVGKLVNPLWLHVNFGYNVCKLCRFLVPRFICHQLHLPPEYAWGSPADHFLCVLLFMCYVVPTPIKHAPRKWHTGDKWHHSIVDFADMTWLQVICTCHALYNTR